MRGVLAYEYGVVLAHWEPEDTRPTLTGLYQNISWSGESHARGFAKDYAAKLSRELHKRNPNGVLVLSDIGECLARYYQGNAYFCHETPLMPRIANPWTPDSARWDRHEVRMGVHADGRVLVTHLTWAAYGGALITKVYDKDAYGETFRSNTLDAKIFVKDLVISLSGVEMKNPNVVRGFDARGQCFYAALHGWQVECDTSIYEHEDATHSFHIVLEDQFGPNRHWVVLHDTYPPRGQGQWERRERIEHDDSGNMIYRRDDAVVLAHALAKRLSAARPDLSHGTGVSMDLGGAGLPPRASYIRGKRVS